MKNTIKNILLFASIYLFSIITLNAQTIEYWGISESGGEYGFGTIYKMDSTLNSVTIENDVFKYYGKNPGRMKLYEANNGKFYGLTQIGGKYSNGVLFEYDKITGEYLVKVHFNNAGNGSHPYGGLVMASNGKLYGTTYSGGANNKGTLFEYDISTNTLVKKIDFSAYLTGKGPHQIIYTSSGKIYGCTMYGGVNNKGVLFEYNIAANTITKRVDFDGNNKGEKPSSGLFEASNGKLYGMTYYGGTNNMGVLFEYDTTTYTLTKKIDFDGTAKGSHPQSTLMQASNGMLYGTAIDGGTNNNGVLFKYDITTGVYTKTLDFSSNISGRVPVGQLIQHSNGKLYGVTFKGGVNNAGVIYEYVISSNTLTIKSEFHSTINGAWPCGYLTLANNGKLYGATNVGGKENLGTLFNYDILLDTLIRDLSFAYSPYGKFTNSSLMLANNGKFYGTMRYGGKYGMGVLFEYDPFLKIMKTKVDFDGVDIGDRPYAALVQANNGKLYGTTYQGGANNRGVLFEYDIITDTIINKFNFIYSDGMYPNSAMTLAANGKLYGLTFAGGTQNRGVLYEYNTVNSSYTIKKQFLDWQGPATFKASMMQASNGKLYGVSDMGGVEQKGVLFEYNFTSNSISVKAEFNDSIGGHTSSTLVEASNGKFYGICRDGGDYGFGVIFEYNLSTDSLNKLFDFDGLNCGKTPQGSLTMATNGKLYGYTRFGGVNNKGVFFEYDILNDTCISIFDVNDSIGEAPYRVKLIKAPIFYNSDSSFSITKCNTYTVPSGDETYTTAGSYFVKDTLVNSLGYDSILTIYLTINVADVGVIINDPSITANALIANYQWLDCDANYTMLLNDTLQTFTATTNGNYAVEITQNLCIDTSACISITGVGIEEQGSIDDIIVSPNPTSGNVRVQLGVLQNVSITVFNSIGKLVYSESKISASDYNFELNVIPGFYLIEIRSEGKLKRLKLIIE